MKEPTFTLGGITFNWHIILVIIVGTLVPMLDWYKHTLTPEKAYDRFIWYFLIPALIITLIFREPLSSYGFRLGDWRVGLRWVGVVCVVMVPILLVVARFPSMVTYYQRIAPDSVGQALWLNSVEMLGWEFVWRGFTLFAFARVFGPGAAIWLQAIPFAYMHLGKPELETLTTLFGGAGFGFIAWKSQSFFYPFLIHWFILSFTMLVATGQI